MKYRKNLIEYLGLETLFQNIINAYEESIGIYGNFTKSTDITRHINVGLEVFDGVYDVYPIGEMAVSSIRCYNGRIYFYGYVLRSGDIEAIDLEQMPDVSVDITDFAADYDINIGKLLYKIHKAVEKTKRQ